MEKRKEKLNPEKINFEKVITELDWTKEITPVDLVKAVNKVEELSGRKKYVANEKYFGGIVSQFEKTVGDLVSTRINGKDRFYTLKPGFCKEQLVHYAQTGEIMEIKKELKKKDSKLFVPDIPESTYVEKKVKKSFPDDEALAKVAILIYMMGDKGMVKSEDYKSTLKEHFGWKDRRYVSDKKEILTLLREINLTVPVLELNPFIYRRKTVSYELENLEEDAKVIKDKIKDIVFFIDDESLRDKVIDFVDPEEPVKIEEPVKKEEKEEPIMELPKPKPVKVMSTPTKTKVYKTSPEIGKSEFRETGSTPIVYESVRTRWNKSLIAATLKGAERGTWISVNDIAQIVKKTRFVDIPTKEISSLIGDIAKQFKGIFREVEFDSITVGDESKVENLIQTYQQEKITEIIFIRLKMTLEEINETYPELKVRVASHITESDNIYEFEMNRSECAERAFAKLVYRMRKDEVILESPLNWTVKRAKVLIDKFVTF